MAIEGIPVTATQSPSRGHFRWDVGAECASQTGSDPYFGRSGFKWRYTCWRLFISPGARQQLTGAAPFSMNSEILGTPNVIGTTASLPCKVPATLRVLTVVASYLEKANELPSSTTFLLTVSRAGSFSAWRPSDLFQRPYLTMKIFSGTDGTPLAAKTLVPAQDGMVFATVLTEAIGTAWAFYLPNAVACFAPPASSFTTLAIDTYYLAGTGSLI